MTAFTALLPAAALLAAATALPPHAAHAAAAASDAPTAPYVVVLKDSTTRASAAAATRALAAEAEASGDTVGAVYDTVLSGFAVRTTAARAAALAADPRVASVEPDAVFRIDDGAPAGSTPAGSALVRNASAGTAPTGGTAPAGNTPAGSTPRSDTPAGSTPAGSTPTGAGPAGSTPVGTTPPGDAPDDGTPADETPAGVAPAGSTPAGSTPAGTTPPGKAPAGTTPPADAPADESPAGTAPPGKAPTGTPPPGDSPTGSTPSGAPPTGSTPPGTAPTGTAPTGATPPGATPPGKTPPGKTPTGKTPAAAPLVQASAPWALDRLDQGELPLDGSYTYPVKAEGVTAYIVDTGINTLHQEFGGRARWGANAVFMEGATDCNGHGTHVAGTVGGATYGVAKGVSLVAVKVADCRGDATLSAITRGLDWMVKDALKSPATPAVANMSLGGGYSFALNRAVTRAIASGITVAVAAGNSGENACTGSPAGVPQALTVGATDALDQRPAFSNYGACVDLSAPGVAVTSAWKGSATATARASGTSMAAPHVAGAAALVLARGLAAGGPRQTPAQVADVLVRDSVRDRITALPAGTPNRLLHVPTEK
ncbi:S8 family serine peptidase [Streptomyces sp. NPDC051546]|uniref:S8 family serine peptidase n=1 Tax=Streptomyces sp. NPDC051546 TaxID=3365655 RepID=UPI0037B484E2